MLNQNNVIDEFKYQSNKDHQSDFINDYKPKKSSKQSISNFKRLKELESTFGLNLDQSPGKRGESMDPVSVIPSYNLDRINADENYQQQSFNEGLNQIQNQRNQTKQPSNFNVNQLQNGNHSLNLKQAQKNPLQLSHQRSVAAKAGQMQIFNTGTGGPKDQMMLQGHAQQIGQSYESYLGRKQIIQQQRDRKEALLRQLESGRLESGENSVEIKNINRRPLDQNQIEFGQNQSDQTFQYQGPLGITGQATGTKPNLNIKTQSLASKGNYKATRAYEAGGSVRARNEETRFPNEDLIQNQLPPRNRFNSKQNGQTGEYNGQNSMAIHSSATALYKNPNILRNSQINQKSSSNTVDSSTIAQSYQTSTSRPSHDNHQSLSISNMRGPVPLSLPKPIRLSSRQIESQSTQMKNQQFKSLLPPPVKGSNIDPAIRRRHIAALRSQQIQNEQVAYSSGPGQYGIGVSQGGEFLVKNGFAENKGIYAGIGSNSVHDLRGGNQQLQFKSQNNNIQQFKDQNNQEIDGNIQDLNFSKITEGGPISQITYDRVNGRPPMIPIENRNEFPSSELSYSTNTAIDKYKYTRQTTPNSGKINYETQPSQQIQNQDPSQKTIDAKPKSYDYLFVQMSNEQFNREYGKKILIQRAFDDEDQQDQKKLQQNSQALSPISNQYRGPLPQVGNQNTFSPHIQGKLVPQMISPQPDAPNLFGIVNVKAYEKQYTNEVPAVCCHLLPTQFDHLKVLVCEEITKSSSKLTQDASERFEIEKQKQVKQYMEDIIDKLKLKDRKHKVTVKKKFIEDAMSTKNDARIASVYVLVINREKNYDPIISQKQSQQLVKTRKPGELGKIRTASVNTLQQVKGGVVNGDSSSSDEAEAKSKLNHEKMEMLKKKKLMMGVIRRSAQPEAEGKEIKGNSYYETQSDGAVITGKERMNSTATSSNIAKLKSEQSSFSQKKRSSVSMSRPAFNKIEEPKFKWVAPKKTFPEKYGVSNIRIVQNVDQHKHHRTHKINVFFQQYNEFVKIMFKHQKSTAQPLKFDLNQAMGLAKCLGLRVNKDTFSEQNLKSRDHLNKLKEQLSFLFCKKLMDDNQDIFPTPSQVSQKIIKKNDDSSDNENETINSSSNTVNNLTLKQDKVAEGTPKAVGLKADIGNENQTAHIRNDGSIMYKYSIGKGNNSMLVKSLFKNRFWWMQSEKAEMEKVNFMWTQIKVIAHMETLLCKFPFKKAGVKQSKGLQKTNDGKQNAITSTPQANKKKKKNLQSSEKQNSTTKNASIKEQQSLANQENIEKAQDKKMYNKCEDNFHLANKKALLLNMRNYYESIGEEVFDSLPVTFHIKNGTDDPEFTRFKTYYDKADEDIKIQKQIRIKKKQEAKQAAAGESEEESAEESPLKTNRKLEKSENTKQVETSDEPKYLQSSAHPKNIWILKPGENTNCGNGIQVAKDFNEIVEIVTESNSRGKRTCIVQKYIHSPLLIHKRKFDIRTYAMITSIGGCVKGYVYEEGYVRTSSYEFDLSNLSDRLVHLTNDAVQKRDKSYGKHEAGNKMSYNELQAYLDRYHTDANVCFDRDLLPQMNKMTADIFRAVHLKLDPKRRLNTFEVFGLDFMIDDEFKLYLIEVNTNPCLELASPLLARLIPNMLENALKIAVDPLFPPPENYSQKKAFIGDTCPENRFELIFDHKLDGPVIEAKMKLRDNIIIELDEEELSDEEEHPDDEIEE